MILSKAQKQFATDFAQGLPQSMLAMMIKSTVRLDAAVQGGLFQASGVIFNVINNKVEILTAAHNLMLWKGLKVPPNDWNELAREFRAICKIRYNPKDAKFNGAPGDRFVRPNGNNDEMVVSEVVNKCNPQDRNATCYYDLAVITCADTKLSDFAKTFLDNNNLGPTATDTVNNQAWFLDTKKYMYFQLGYGKTTDTRKPQTLGKDDNGREIVKFGVAEDVKCGEGAGMDAHNLHYRVAKPLNADYACFYDQVAADTKAPVYSANCKAIEFRASKNNSTAEGDSGGPVYAIKYTEEETEDEETGKVTNTVTYEKASLLGLTTGADMMAGKEPPGATYFNDISTSVIPYLTTRRQG